MIRPAHKLITQLVTHHTIDPSIAKQPQIQEFSQNASSSSQYESKPVIRVANLPADNPLQVPTTITPSRRSPPKPVLQLCPELPPHRPSHLAATPQFNPILSPKPKTIQNHSPTPNTSPTSTKQNVKLMQSNSTTNKPPSLS